jgi:hypothetical protein
MMKNHKRNQLNRSLHATAAGLVHDHRIRHLPPYYDPDILYDSIRIRFCADWLPVALFDRIIHPRRGLDQISPFFRSLCAPLAATLIYL